MTDDNRKPDDPKTDPHEPPVEPPPPPQQPETESPRTGPAAAQDADSTGVPQAYPRAPKPAAPPQTARGCGAALWWLIPVAIIIALYLIWR